MCVPGSERRRPLSREALERVGVDRALADLEDIATAPRHERPVRAEGLAQPRDVGLKRLRRRGRRRAIVEILDEAVRGNHLAPVQQQQAQERTLTRSAQRERTTSIFDLQGPQDPIVHRLCRNRL